MKRIGILLVLSALSLSIWSQTHWTKHPGNPILSGGSSGEWDEILDFIGSVILSDDTYMMWYSASDGQGKSVGLANSGDGIAWTKDANNPVFEPDAEGSWDQDYVACGDVTMVNDTFHMWYTGYKGHWDQSAIGHAYSIDGIEWTRDPENPVLTLEMEGSLDDGWIWIDEVVYDGNYLHMWYSAASMNLQKGHVGHATSTDGSQWTIDPSNPAILPGNPEDWDSPVIAFTEVVYDGSVFHMWYAGGNNVPSHIYDIGYASSPDGITWNKYGGNPVLKKGKFGTWDSRSIWSGNVIDSAGVKYQMWYRGSSASSWAFGYAESYDPAWKLMNDQDPGGMTCVVDSLIYSFSGGWEDWNIGNEAWCYNPTSNEWIRLPDMPVPMTEGGLGHVDGKIYLVGGWVNFATGEWMTTDSVLEYDIANERYAFKKKCGVHFGSGADCVMDNKILLFGGHGATFPNENHAFEAFLYDPVNEIWDDTFFPNMNYAHLMHGSAEVLDGDVFLIGGVGPGPDYELQRSERSDGESWEPIAEMPVPVTLHNSIVHNGKILVFGGDSLWTLNKSYSTNFIQEYDPESDTWRMMEPMPFQRTAMEGDKIDNFMYLIGGGIDQRDPSSGFVSEVWRFNLDSLKEWAAPCNEVLVSESSLDLEIGQTSTLSASVMPAYAADRTVSWSSSNEEIATVSADGEVTAVSDGEASITAVANGGGCTASCSLEVYGVGISILKADQISVFPNPVIDLLDVKTGLSEDHLIEISSLNGHILYSMIMDRPSYKIDLSSFQEGVYFITIRAEDFVSTRKIIKF